jgi:ell wall binding domain 2 (CWB2)
MPSWQTALAVVSGNTGTICGISSTSMCREVPDVSASAQPSNGYRIFFTSNGTSRWFTIGGTSAAAPTWAALIALADASTSCNGHRLGFLNPALYLLRAAWPADFHDVTSGNNDAVGANSGKYAAGPGYDMATGLGTPVGANLTGDLCSDGSGTMTVDQTAINASTRTTLHFTYTAAAGHNLTAGQIDIAVPAGWSTPSTTSSSAGYTTASPGTVSVSSNTIQVSGLTLASGSTVTITYGDTSGTGGGAVSPNAAQTATFSTTQKGLSTGTLTALASSPQVLVGGPDGSGTLAVSPSSIAPSTLTTLTFTYSPAVNTSLAAGTVAITVPVGGTTGWTQPNTTPATAGYVTVSTGSVSVSGSTIRVDGVTIPVGGSLTITYGSGSGGAVPSPSATTTTNFTAQERNTSSGTLSALTPSPSVLVGTPPPGGGGGGGAGPAAQTLSLARIAGADRIATSIAASQTGFPTTHSAAAVVLARSDTFADALAGTPLAVGKHGPLLLTGSASLSSATSAEIQRVLAPGATVYVLGGISAVTPAVASAVAALGHPVVRISGPDRFATAAQVAAALGNPSIVFEADGTNFPDALSAGSAAAEAGGVVLLTAGSGQSGPTAAYLSAHPSATRYAIGGPAAHADPSAQPFVGSDRFATSVLVAQAFFPKPASVGLASGLAFPDALSGGSVAAMNHGPVVLVPSNGALPSSVASYLATAQASATSAWLFGGTSSVGADIFNSAAAILAPTA